MLIHQQLFNLSNEEIEFQVNDWSSFEEFVGHGVVISILDATTIAFFREIAKGGGDRGALRGLVAYPRSQSLQARGGQIIDATLDPVPKQGCLKVESDAVSRELNTAQREHAFDVLRPRAQTQLN